MLMAFFMFAKWVFYVFKDGIFNLNFLAIPLLFTFFPNKNCQVKKIGN
jgi:hypothetical protein